MTARVLYLDRFFKKINKTETCWLWTGSKDGHGYGMFRVAPDRVRRAHRVSYEIANGPVPDGTVFLHSCDTPSCVNPDHVRPGSHAENAADRDAKGRHWTRSGASHGMAKLTEEAVREIRSVPRYAHGALPSLAKKYGVAMHTIYCIRSGANWAGVA